MDADFIFLLEPRETGHFNNKEVTLSEGKVKVLESFYLKVKTAKENKNYPSFFILVITRENWAVSVPE